MGKLRDNFMNKPRGELGKKLIRETREILRVDVRHLILIRRKRKYRRLW